MNRQMMHFIKFLLGVFMLSACSTSLESYKDKGPRLELDRFFNGEMKAWGVVMSRSHVVTRRFTATLKGEWKDNVGSLKEEFLFDNKEIQKREWKIKKTADNKYEGTASDVEGTGFGETSGFAMNWKYTLKIPVDGTVYNVPFDDSMFLVDEKNLINRAVMTKFGIRIGEIIIFIQKI